MLSRWPIRALSLACLILGCVCLCFFLPSLDAANRLEHGADHYSVDIDSIVSSAAPPAINAQYHRVYLLDSQSKEIFDDFTYSESFHQIYQITSAEGVQAFGTEIIEYQEGFDSVDVIIARSFSPNGDTISVPPDQVMTGISPSDLMENDLYTDERQVRVNFGSLNIGSIVELNYAIRHYREVLPFHSGRFYFRLSEPSNLGILSITHSKNLKLYTRAANKVDEPLLTSSGGTQRRHG